jgi:hypothetical protein
MLNRLIGEMFGGGARAKAKPPQVGPMPQDQPVAPQAAGPLSGDPAEVLRQALAHVESMPRDLADLRRWLGDVFQHLDDVLSRLDGEARRLAETSSRLADVAGRLEDRMADGRTPAAVAREEAPAEEPSFAPGGAVGIVLAAVPGFQGLMDVQRALSALPETEAATVIAFKDGEASLEVTLRSAITARRLVEGLQQATGHPLLIEDVRPEASKLRLRFVEPQRA